MHVETVPRFCRTAMQAVLSDKAALILPEMSTCIWKPRRALAEAPSRAPAPAKLPFRDVLPAVRGGFFMPDPDFPQPRGKSAPASVKTIVPAFKRCTEQAAFRRKYPHACGNAPHSCRTVMQTVLSDKAALVLPGSFNMHAEMRRTPAEPPCRRLHRTKLR